MLLNLKPHVLINKLRYLNMVFSDVTFCLQGMLSYTKVMAFTGKRIVTTALNSVLSHLIVLLESCLIRQTVILPRSHLEQEM